MNEYDFGLVSFSRVGIHDDKKRGSSEIWSDKLKLLHIRHTESRRDGGKANITEVPTAQRATEV